MTTFPEVREARKVSDDLHRVSTICDHHYSLDREAAQLIDAQAAEIERLHAGIANSHKGIERLRAVCIDYAIIVGELSKGLTQDDPLWADILRAGAALEQTK